MANKKISELTELTAGNTAPTTDFLAIVDTSATETKKVTPNAVVADALAQTTSKTISGPTVISVNSASDALRITQTGAGNCLVVEDSANPDSSPLVINTDGTFIIGNTIPVNTQGGFSPIMQIHGTTDNTTFNSITRWTADSFDPRLFLGKSRGATIGTHGIVSSGDVLGAIRFVGSDGTNFVRATEIRSEVDGTPGTNDMPGRLVFSTTADGASSPTERMRIDSVGRVGVGVTPSGGYMFRIGGNAATDNGIGISSSVTITSPVVSSYVAFSTFGIQTEAAAFTLSTFKHFECIQGTVGAGSAITNQYGFFVGSSLTGGTNNYSFYGNLSSGSGKWNFYANGTARNYFAGGVEVLAGTTTQAAGFLNCSAAAGVPTGVPTNPTGNVPIYYDTTNNKLYVYNGAWRSTAALT